MNILLVTPFFSPQTGGVATYLEDLRRFLGAEGHQIFVLRSGEARTIRQCQLNRDQNVYEFYFRTPWNPGAHWKGLLAFVLYFIPTLWRLYVFIKERRIQLVSLEYPLGFMLYFLPLRWCMPFKVTVGLHGDDILSLDKLPRYERRVVVALTMRADWVLAHSSSLLVHAQRIIRGLHDRRSYLPYGTDCERLRWRAATQDSIPAPATPYILTVAKLYERKGIDVLLRAVKQIETSLDGHTMLIVGDGPEEIRLKQLAERLGLLHVVTFAGDIPNAAIPRFFRDCSFFVLPSRSEPFGIVLLEAMVFGKAVVATRVGGIPEFVEDGKTGLLVPPEDPDTLASHMALLIQDRDRRDAIGKNGLALVESVYDQRKVMRQYEAMYSRIIFGHMSV